MKVSMDRQKGANAWLTIELKEGKNREIRRAMSELSLLVNRLIRVEYGPFKLGSLKRGELVEINRKSISRSLKSVNIDFTKANNKKNPE
jgi:23S rRNA pseudouridine2605 synthase